MKISDIPKNLQIKRPPIFKNKGGLRILGAGSMKHRIKVFRPIRPGAKHGHGNKKNRRQRKRIWHARWVSCSNPANEAYK